MNVSHSKRHIQLSSAAMIAHVGQPEERRGRSATINRDLEIEFKISSAR